MRQVDEGVDPAVRKRLPSRLSKAPSARSVATYFAGKIKKLRKNTYYETMQIFDVDVLKKPQATSAAALKSF